MVLAHNDYGHLYNLGRKAAQQYAVALETANSKKFDPANRPSQMAMADIDLDELMTEASELYAVAKDSERYSVKSEFFEGVRNYIRNTKEYVLLEEEFDKRTAQLAHI